MLEPLQFRQTNPINFTRLGQKVSLLSILVVLLTGVGALLGWWLDWPVLAGSPSPELPPMTIPSALAFIAAAISLGCLQRQWHSTPPARVMLLRAARIFAGLVILLGVLGLGERLLQWHLDPWFFHQSLHARFWVAPDWMPLGAGINFVLIGYTLLLSTRSQRWSQRLAQLLTLGAALIAIHALLNNIHPLGLSPAYPAPPIDLLTAIGFLVLGAGIQSLHVDETALRLLSFSDGPSESLVCQLLVAVIALALLEALVTLWQHQQTTGELVIGLSLLTIKTIFLVTWLVGWSISLLTRIHQDHQQADAIVDQSLVWFQLAQEAASLGRWYWDAASEQMHWCAYQEQLFGLAPGTFDGTFAAFLASVHLDDRAGVQARFTQALITQQDYFDQYRVLWPDGSQHWVLVKGHCTGNPDGQVIRVSGVSLDITEHQELQEQQNHLLHLEQAARTRAEAANRMKDEFLSILSHEVRTPLNSLLGWVRLFRERTFNPEMAARGLEILERNAEAQAQIIEDMLDMARVVQGKLQLQLQHTNLNTVIQSAVAILQPAAEAKSITLSTQMDANFPEYLGDPERLRQVVWNLLSNAVKFTPEGGRVEVKLAHKGREAALIIITDTGRGISPDFLPYVFDRFRQEDSTTTRSYGGLGLGLALVRYLVELHGGTVEATSPGVGLGATFIVRLPLRGGMSRSERQ